MGNLGGYSQIEAYQSIMRMVIESGINYHHIFLLSGLDYPLWSNKEIFAYLNQNYNVEFIQAKCISGTKECSRKCKRYHPFRDLKLRNRTLFRAVKFSSTTLLRFLPFRKPDYVKTNGIKNYIYYGSVWFCLTGDCLAYVYNQLSTNKDWKNYFKLAYTPDELIVATIVYNSYFAPKAVSYGKNESIGLSELTYFHYIEYDSEIHTYDENDYDKLMNSGKMFVRKLTSKKSINLIKLIDQKRDQTM